MLVDWNFPGQISQELRNALLNSCYHLIIADSINFAMNIIFDIIWHFQIIPIFSLEQNQKIPNPPDRQGQRIPADESGALLRTKRCYHVEYFLLPDDLVPRKLDLVVFGMVAKLFAERDSKVKDTVTQSNPKFCIQETGECFQQWTVLVAYWFNNCLDLICAHRYRDRY